VGGRIQRSPIPGLPPNRERIGKALDVRIVDQRIVAHLAANGPSIVIEQPARDGNSAINLALQMHRLGPWQSWQTVNDPLVQLFKPPNYLTMR
jgi:hypothetical protein